MNRPRSWAPWFQGSSFAEGRALPGELTQPIATTSDGRDITRAWVRELEEARDPRLAMSVDWGVYDRILLDDQVKSCLEQRIRAVVSRDWTVLSGNEGDARADAAAEAFNDHMNTVGWDRTTEKMLYAPFYGYAVAELMWGASAGALGWMQTGKCRPIHVRHARRFRFTGDGDLRLLTRARPNGEPLPERKFWVVTTGGTDDDTPYGRGLAEWLYWPTVFKRNGVRFWNTFLDKFSVPTAKGTYPRGTSREDIEKFLAALQAIATDSGFVVPEGMAVELLDAAKSGADFGAVCRYMDGAIAKIILSQTMTTDNGSSRSQAEVHADVKLEIVKADADLLSDSFNAGPARWWTNLNFGADVPSPRLMRIVEEEDDLKAQAETDEALDRLGWTRTEESFQDRYGEGYVRKETPQASTAPVAKPTGVPGAANDDAVIEGLAVALAEAGVQPRDVVDDAVDAAMMDDGWRGTLGAMVDPLLAKLAQAASADEVRLILQRESELGDDAPLATALARAGFAVRVDAMTDDRDE